MFTSHVNIISYYDRVMFYVLNYLGGVWLRPFGRLTFIKYAPSINKVRIIIIIMYR